MGLPKHKRNEGGEYRRERSDSLAGNLRKDYSEFGDFRADAHLGNIKKRLGLPDDPPINIVRKAIRDQRKK